MELSSLGQSQVLRSANVDVVVARERARQHRIRRIVIFLAIITAFVVLRDLAGHPIGFGLPHLPPALANLAPALILIVLLGAMLAVPMIGAGRSPHIMFRADEIDVSFDDVKGADVVVEEVVKSLNLFLAYKTFKERMGGTPRRAILF
jgi:cell division protease FtsH